MSNIKITSWSIAKPVFAGAKKKLDIYFQPGLSWVKEPASEHATKVIALFFLENDPGKGEPGKDFQFLVEAMLRWIWAVAGNVDDTVAKPPDYYKDLYDALLEKPFDYDDFQAFLKANVEFRIQAPTAKLHGTIFPMFPELTLSVGEPGTAPPQYPITKKGIQDKLGNLTAQFAYDHEFQDESSTTALSARKLIFSDYGQLLLRTALKELLEFLPLVPEPKPEPADMPTISLKRVLECLAKNKTVAEIDAELPASFLDDPAFFDRLASIASRFMLHGLRLPVSSPVSVKPVFEATGQQFMLFSAKDTSTPATGVTKPDYTIKLTRPPAQSGYLECYPAGIGINSPSAATLPYDIYPTESTANTKYPLVAMIDGFNDVSKLGGDPLQFKKDNNGEAAGIIASPFYRYQKRIFSMRKWIGLGLGAAAPFTFILQVPSSLRQFLSQTAVNPAIDLYSSPASQREEPVQPKVANNTYQWAVQIELIVRQVPKTGAAGFLPGVFELVDISESQINLLESVIRDSHLDHAHIQVVRHADGADGLAPLPGLTGLPNRLSEFALIRHNFATNGSIPATAPKAIANLPAESVGNDNTRESSNKQFLQLLWEGATIESGGYYFDYAITGAEQEALFASKESIVLSLLIKYDIHDDPIFDFHNAVIIDFDTKDFLEKNLLLATVESAKYDVPVLAMPPGFIGFKHETTAPKTGPVKRTPQATTPLRQTPSTTGALTVPNLTLPTDKTVYILNLSRDGEWAFVALDAEEKQTGWVPLVTETVLAGALPVKTTYLSDLDNYNQTQALAELKSLYHLLGYGITGDPLSNNLPIGPAEMPTGSTDGWRYEKLIPAHDNLNQDTPPKNWPKKPLLPWKQNPYRGITASSQLSFDFWWQDIYGNKITTKTATKSFDVRYTDPLIGINQWPSINEQYQFVKNGKGLWLEIELQFSTAPYADLKPGVSANQKEVLSRRLKADLITYQMLYYQLHGPGLHFEVTSSLDNTWSHRITVDQLDQNKNSLSNFILKIYEYLNGLLKDPANAPSYKDKAYSLQIDLKALKPKDRFIQGISCWMTMQRKKKFVHPTLKNKPESTNIFENKAVLSPKHEAAEHPILAGQSLDAVAKAINLKQSTALTAEGIVLQHRSVPGIIHGGQVIEIDTLTLKNEDPEKPRETFKFRRTALKQQEQETKNLLDPQTQKLISTDIERSRTITTEPYTGQAVETDANAEKIAHFITVSTDPATGQQAVVSIDGVAITDAIAITTEPTTGQITLTDAAGKAMAQFVILSTDPTTGQLIARDATGTQLKTYYSGVLITNDLELREPLFGKIKTQAGDSFEALAQRINAEMKKTLGPNYSIEFTLADLAENFKGKKDFLQGNTKLTLEPLNLRQFAANFSEAFPDFHIAVSEESNAGGGQANMENNKPEFLFAIRLGGTGIRYDITDQTPNFYAIPPVATTLFSGKAMLYVDPKNQVGGTEKEVESVDANILAREFLDALEEILEPEILAPARKDATAAASVLKLLEQKIILAKKITDTVAPILKEDDLDPTLFSTESARREAENARREIAKKRLDAAKEAIHQRLLHNLLEGFDIESIVQYEATIGAPGKPQATDQFEPLPPRMVGKAKVLRIRVGSDPEERMPAEADDLDYTLSTGYFELDQNDGQSSFTCLFDTKTPDKFGELELEMEFQPLEMEFNLEKFPEPTSSFESSNKLHFILPANLNVYKVDVALSTRLTGLFGTETAFSTYFSPALTSLLNKKHFALTELEDALQDSMQTNYEAQHGNDPNPPKAPKLHDLPYRKYLDALLSDANPNYMGRTEVPIPLRNYPLSPSLILQQAEADDSSRELIRDLREWQYTIVYEHPEVAQDSIDCIIRLNVPDTEQTLGNTGRPATVIPEFVRLLLNFNENLSDMKAAINTLKDGGTATAEVQTALANFAYLSEEIAKNWALVRSTTTSDHYVPLPGDLHFEISEETLSYVGNTREAETREGVVIKQVGLAENNLIKLDKAIVERVRIPTPEHPALEERLKNGSILKRGAEPNHYYLKPLGPILELPGFLSAKRVEVDKAEVEKNGIPTEVELVEMGLVKREIIEEGKNPDYSYLITVFPGKPLPDLVTDPSKAANPAIDLGPPESRTFFYLIDPDDQTFFGDSSIPDRKFSIENLDLLQQQNAWASIWLSRNKFLAHGKTTNPDFIFRTPAVRFTNRVTPSIVNREPWDIATLPNGDTAARASLGKHILNMLDLFKPGVRTPGALHKRYELQIACRYAYTMALGSGLNEDLVTTLPILLGLRLDPDQLSNYPALLSKEISNWFKANLPVEENAALIFSVEAYSQLDPNANTSLPLLRVTQLELKLDDISNMQDIKTGNG